ncbi:hypothetical protein AUK22_06560 [bacterium CG2_30_54_10]|nr:MAG: hypothetical protein AUK22_06560 [bacterium CG2_30_54_10]
MQSDVFPQNPRERLNDPDIATRRMAFAAIARDPQPYDREVFEEALYSPDTATALLAYLGLRSMWPTPTPIDQTWKELFSESIELLVNRASTGPVQLRVAALQALAFAPESPGVALVERILQSLGDAAVMETGSWREAPTLPLVQTRHSMDLPEGFALLLSALPLGRERIQILKRELLRKEFHRLLPVLIALQMMPVPELTDQILACVRSNEPRVAAEAARALLACGGRKVYLLILSLLKETVDPRKKAIFLPLAARTGRSEVWQVILSHLLHSSPLVRRAGAIAISSFPSAAVSDQVVALQPLLKDKDPIVVCEAARALWHLGSMEALTLVENLFRSGDSHQRAIAAECLGELPADTAVPILIEDFGKERHGDVIRQVILSLRRLLPRLASSSGLSEHLLPILKRLMGSTDPFLRSQVAVLAGILGRSAEDLLLAALEKPEHPHVLASLIAALGHIGNSRLLVLARFHDHPDPRVRSNLMTAFLTGGQGAIPYLTTGLKDPSPRVRAAAAHSLFLLGQLEVIPVLNRMLLVPSPVSVLAACHALAKLMRVSLPILEQGHPLPLSLSRKARRRSHDSSEGPILLRFAELPRVFDELSIAGGDIEKTLWVLENNNKSHPASHPIRRMLASIYAFRGLSREGLSLLETCIRDHPGILADLLDAYRLSLVAGDLPRAEAFGKKARVVDQSVLNACIELSQSLRGKGAEAMLERLHTLSLPSMNIYSAMIQLKALEGDAETVLDLLSEILLARPTNGVVALKLANLLPESMSDLAKALQGYIQNLPLTLG